MKRKYEKVYQFKISLNGIEPPIWRGIQVPGTYNFWDLHVAIQDAMGWLDYHLHHFEVKNPRTQEPEEIGIPDEEGWGNIEIIPGWSRRISTYFTGSCKKAKYIYDYGDCWEHTVQLEKIVERLSAVDYPKCIAGKRACPPEDCGGRWGYEDFLNIILTPDHDRHQEMLNWIGGHFAPEHFDVDEVDFDDPVKRKKIAFR
ncbi:MAG: plasmid pRiA4b ORF-3 family protein [bacterium]|nr:plasmid pRiA4b ORF-3 family protein [bacterium]